MRWWRLLARGAIGRQRQTLRALFLAVPVAAVLLGLFTLASANDSWKAVTDADEVVQPATDAADPAQTLDGSRSSFEGQDLDNPSDLAVGEGGSSATPLDGEGAPSSGGAGAVVGPTTPAGANPVVVAPPEGEADPSTNGAPTDTAVLDAAAGPDRDRPGAEDQESASGSGEPEAAIPQETRPLETTPAESTPVETTPVETAPESQTSESLESVAPPRAATESETADGSSGSAESDSIGVADPQQGTGSQSPAGPLGQPGTEDEGADRGLPLGRLVGLLIAVGLAVALGISALIGLVRFLAARRGRSAAEATGDAGEAHSFMLDGPSTGRALDRLRKELETEADPRLAIRRAYAVVESGFGNEALARQSSETPGDYLARSLARIEGAEADLASLTELFTIARYSRHPVTEDMRLAAIESVMALRARYRLSNLVAS